VKNEEIKQAAHSEVLKHASVQRVFEADRWPNFPDVGRGSSHVSDISLCTFPFFEKWDNVRVKWSPANLHSSLPRFIHKLPVENEGKGQSKYRFRKKTKENDSHLGVIAQQPLDRAERSFFVASFL
jgi:hypothetical protein